jgi:hypothetical protein
MKRKVFRAISRWRDPHPLRLWGLSDLWGVPSERRATAVSKRAVPTVVEATGGARGDGLSRGGGIHW